MSEYYVGTLKKILRKTRLIISCQRKDSNDKIAYDCYKVARQDNYCLLRNLNVFLPTRGLIKTGYSFKPTERYFDFYTEDINGGDDVRHEVARIAISSYPPKTLYNPYVSFTDSYLTIGQVTGVFSTGTLMNNKGEAISPNLLNPIPNLSTYNFLTPNTTSWAKQALEAFSELPDLVDDDWKVKSETTDKGDYHNYRVNLLQAVKDYGLEHRWENVNGEKEFLVFVAYDQLPAFLDALKATPLVDDTQTAENLTWDGNDLVCVNLSKLFYEDTYPDLKYLFGGNQ